jgi:DNA-binding transcriptional MerR regulator
MKQDYPSKLYYSISEVAEITDVKAHVLRYWESEFPTLRPKKARTGSRRYRPTDIAEVLAIKHLLYDEGFKIAGARKLRRQAHQSAPATTAKPQSQLAISFDGMTDSDRLSYLRGELTELLDLVKQLAPAQEQQKRQAKA